MVRLPVVPWPNISSSYQLPGVPKKSSTRQKEPYIHIHIHIHIHTA